MVDSFQFLVKGRKTGRVEMCSRDGGNLQDLSESKRKSRNLSEKKRRDAFNSLVTELALLVTGVDRRLDKSNVLKQTISFLRKHNKLEEEWSNGTDVIDNSLPPFLSSSEYFHLLLGSLDAFVFVVDIGEDGDSANVSYVSENATRFGLGMVDRLHDKSLFDILDPEYQTFVRETFRGKIAETKRTHSMENSEIASSTAFLGFVCVVGTWCDDSAKVEMELAVKGRFKMINDSGLVCVCLAKPQWPAPLSGWNAPAVSSSLEFSCRMTVDWKFIQFDQNMINILGYQQMEMMGMSWYDFCHPDDLEILAECHEQLKTNSDGATSPYRFRTKSEDYVWIRSRFYITYHEWNAKLEFITCTHVVIDSFSQDTSPIAIKSSQHCRPLIFDRTGPANIQSISVNEASRIQPQQHQNRQIIRPQPGVRIEHTPIPNAAAPRPPAAKKLKGDTGAGASVRQEDVAESINQLNERMLWELLEKRQSNLQEKILQHQRELKHLQEQLLNAMPLLSTTSPASSSNSTSEMELISPASFSLSPASGPLSIPPAAPVWTPQTQQAAAHNQTYSAQFWGQKFF